MKIMIRTSRTSISGTMFGSDIDPLPPPTVMPMRNPFSVNRAASQYCYRTLLARFDLRGYEAHVVDACAAHDVNRASDVGELHVVIALDEGHFLGALFEDVFQARPEIIPGDLVLVDHYFSV